MTVVVSDTSVLRALYFLDLLSLLDHYFSQVVIPPAVDHELRHPPRPYLAVDMEQFRQIQIRQPRDASRVREFMNRHLDIGEAEALALAIEIEADAILIDESMGRAAATREGIPPIGVIGILIRAKHDCLIEAIRPCLDHLRSNFGFFIAEALYQRILADSDEQV